MIAHQPRKRLRGSSSAYHQEVSYETRFEYDTETVEERLGEHDDVIQEMYDNILEIPLQRMEEVEEEIRTLTIRLETVEAESTTLRARVRGAVAEQDVSLRDKVSFYTLFRALGWLLEEIHVTWAHLEKKRTRIQLYTKSHEDNAYSGWRRPNNWLKRLPALQNDILMFEQHQVQIFYDHVNPATRRTIDQSASGKLRDKNAEESWALLEKLALYDNEILNNPRDFAKLVKEISLPQDIPMNKITSSYEICSSPKKLNIAWKISSKLLLITHHEAGGLVSNFMESQNARLSKFEADIKQQQGKMTNKINTVLKAINDQMTGALPTDMVKNPKLNVNSTSSFLYARSYPMEDPNAHLISTIRSMLLQCVPSKRINLIMTNLKILHKRSMKIRNVNPVLTDRT
ncbi:hypothetical protein Tco_0716181 [Tanacetum coccineum]